MNRTLAIIFILFNSVIHSQTKVEEQIKIPFNSTDNGHIIVKAQVNGIEGQFIFDTGAGMNLLTKEFADKIKDLEETHHFHTGHRATGEEIKSNLWNSKTLKINKFEIEKEVFAVYDLDFPLDGLISLTPFKNKQITIDFENKILSIESEKSLNRLVSEKDFEIPIIVSSDKDITIGIATFVNLENKLPILANLDSGAGFGVYRFNSRYMTDLGIDSTELKSEYRKSYFKPEKGNIFYFTTLSKLTDESKNASTNNLKVSFIDGLIHEGIMGIDWIGKKITIDMPNERLIVQK